MKNILIFSIVTFCLSCKKEEPLPDIKVMKGSIEATADRKQWPDKGNVFQITFENVSQDTRYPCNIPSPITIGIMSFGGNYIRVGGGFYLTKKLGKFKISQSSTDGHIDCDNLPYSSGMTYFSEDGDAIYSNYELDLAKANFITISEIDNNKIVGSFQINCKKVSGFLNVDYPENITIICTKFTAVLP